MTEYGNGGNLASFSHGGQVDVVVGPAPAGGAALITCPSHTVNPNVGGAEVRGLAGSGQGGQKRRFSPYQHRHTAVGGERGQKTNDPGSSWKEGLQTK